VILFSCPHTSKFLGSAGHLPVYCITQPNTGQVISIESASSGLRIFWFKPNVICIIFVPYCTAHISVF